MARTPDLVAQNIERLATLFPGCVTETKDAQTGALKRAVDFDQLRQELSGHLVEGPHERYHLNWPGKRDALIAANAPVARTLRPCRNESVHFDTTRNLFIEGDNLEALKLLQEAYLGEVKLIYIDPPYNTGNDFLYRDNFAQSRSSYLLRSNQRDDSGRQLVTNRESNGRFHSDWLSMIFARLRLARNLLRTDGAIFISVDDHEAGNLRSVCDEVFGETNFVATIVWQKRYVSNVTAQWLSDMHDYILVYARQKEALRFEDWAKTDEQKAAYTNRDNDPRGIWRAQDLSASKPYAAGLFEITGPTGGKFSPPPNRYWRCSEQQFNAWRADNRIWWGVNNDARPMLKSFLDESERGITPHTWWDHEFAGHNKEATLEMKALFDGASPFDTPKPVQLMTRILELAAGPDSLVLDFFAGSCSMAQAVMKKNAEDGLRRRFIMVQMPEPLPPESPWLGKGYRTIADIGRERIRRAGAGLASEGASDTPDIGFRALRVDTSGVKDVNCAPDALKQEDLLAHADNLKEDRTGEDLLFQILLDWGVDLSLPVKTEDIGGKCVFFVNGNALAACFDQDLSEELVTEMARRRPRKAVFRDSSYSSDSAKINVEQRFRMLSPETEVRTV
jgi:adenine-specific DNA-methyltransferase